MISKQFPIWLNHLENEISHHNKRHRSYCFIFPIVPRSHVSRSTVWFSIVPPFLTFFQCIDTVSQWSLLKSSTFFHHQLSSVSHHSDLSFLFESMPRSQERLCPICSKVFQNGNSLRAHKRQYHQTNIAITYKSPTDETSISTTIQRNRRGTLNCVLCEFQTKFLSSLKRHIHGQHGAAEQSKCFINLISFV